MGRLKKKIKKTIIKDNRPQEIEIEEEVQEEQTFDGIAPKGKINFGQD
jgi:hypothetical protein